MKKTLFIISIFCLTSCFPEVGHNAKTSKSGVKEMTAKVGLQSNGQTVEQNNIAKRLERDNDVGSVKHLYVISAYSGQVLIYSTVIGKVTSSGKRLTNESELVLGDLGEWSGDIVMPSIQDDGTYGSSIPYIYWFDSKSVYHQHYVSGGQILHISDQPISVGSVTINMEQAEK